MALKRLIALACGVVSALALAACSSSGSSTGGGKTIVVGIQGPAASIPAFVARDQGILKKNGIENIKFVTFTNVPAMLTAVAQDQVDIANTVPVNVVQYNEQAPTPLRYLTAANTFDFYAYASNNSDIPVASADEWLPTVRAWRGKTIGVPAPGSATQKLVEALVALAGLKANDVKYVTTGVGPSVVSAIKQGIADVAVSGIDATLAMRNSHVGKVVMQIGPQGPDYMRKAAFSSGMVASNSTITKKADLLRSFQNAWLAGVKYVQDPANTAAVVKTIAKAMAMTDAQAQQQLEITGFPGPLSVELMQNTLSIYSQVGALPGPQAATKVVWLPNG